MLDGATRSDAASRGAPSAVALSIRAAVRRVGSRMRIGLAIEVGTRALWGLGIVGLALITSARLGWLRAPIAGATFSIAAIVAAAVVLWRARPVAAIDAATRADRALGLFDRVASALSFLDEPVPTPLMQLAIADGARVSASIDPRRVVTLGLPRSARAFPLLAVALGLAAFTRLPHPNAIAPAPVAKPRLVVEQDALVAERQALRKLRDEQKGKDPALAGLAQQLDEILDQIDRQQLSRAEAFDKLAKLEAKVAAERAATPPPPKRELEALQKALAGSKATRAVAEALQKDDLSAAQHELQKLAAEAEARAQKNGDTSKKDEAQAELARALDKASRALDEARKQADAERDRKIEALKEEERRLQREKQEHPDDEETERKLQRNQRELERLEREKQAQQEQRRQLQRLSRDLEKAAEQLRQKMSPEAMKRAAEELSKMEEEIKKLGSSAQAMMQIAELKEVLRRAGRSDSSGGGQGADGKGQGTRKKPGQGDERDQQLREFDDRAGGQPNALLLGGDDPGQGSVMLPLPMGSGDDPGGNGDRGDRPGDGDPQRPGGDIGHEHDPNLLGDRTHLATEQKLIHAQGKAGAGPSKSQTILGAAERGFSTRDYQRVYKDYSAVVEEVMSQEGVPPGYRYYVKRYFQLIAPRE